MPIGVSAGVGAALTGVSAIAGLFGKKQTAVQQPLYTQDQLETQKRLSDSLRDAGPADLTPLKTAAASSINRDYDGAQTSLESRLAARGFGNSGKLVTNEKNLQIARAGSLGNLESQFAALQLDQQNKQRDQQQRFAFASPGSKSSGTSGGGPGGAIGGAAETASLLYALNHFLTGGKAPGGSGSGEAPQGGGWFGGGPGDWGGET